MRKVIYLLLVLAVNLSSFAQSFTFEDTVPTEWISSGTGSLSVNQEHYKEGAQSLCWTATGTTTLTVTLPSSAYVLASTGNSAYLQIYSPSITNDTLTVEFLYYSTVKKKAIYLLNYKGWHEFNRAYTEYASNLSTSIMSIRFTLKPTSKTATRKIYFDNVDFNHTTDAERIIGSQWVLDKQYFGSSADTSSLSLFANPVDLPVTTPTSQELADLNSLRVTLKRTPSAGTTTDLNAAKAYVNSLNIIRNPDGSVQGNVIDCSAAALTDAFMIDICNKIEILAAAALTDAPTKVLFQNFVDHLLDQGISEGCNYRTFSNSYTSCKVVPASWLDALPACTSDEKTEILKLVKWFSFYGTMYYPQNTYLANQVSDIIYLFTPHMLGIALNQQDDAVAVRELKAFKRYMDRNTEYVPGGGDILKPDGSGFHHNTQYNNYMYAYKTWVQYLYYLKGTQYKISADAYQRLKKAIISVYTMGTLDAGDAHYFANSLCGRKPFDIQVQFTKTLFDNLIAIGGDILGTQDNELANAYNYFFQTSKYSGFVAQPYEGFYQFNYGNMGVYRKSNWVATMKAPSLKMLSSEIYDNTNRFGRYQGDGSLEIMYAGTLDSNGYPSSSSASGGWDWNCVPGATVVQYTSWQEMMPYKSVTGRFDQRTKTKNFSGALSFGNCGIFASDFDQIDTWSTTAFTATNLVFKKSMYAFDNMIISLGSNISSSGTYSTSMPTTTNLFQCLDPASVGNFVFNGTTLVSPYTLTSGTSNDNWLITPQGTGYFIPKGNDNIEIRFQNQSTPVYTGADYAAPTTTVMAAKAYLNHGIKPSSKSYSFVVVPGTTTAQMQTLAAQMANGGGSIYQVLSQSSSYHAVLYKPLNITAYCFFGAVSGLSNGVVKSTTSEHLLLDKYDSSLNRHYFAISNPNMHPQTDATYGWISTANQTTLTLTGDWKPLSVVSGVSFSAPSNGQTQVNISMYNGEPLYFTAIPYTTSVSNPTIEDVVFRKKTGSIEITFPQGDNSAAQVSICDVNGKILKELSNIRERSLEIPLSGLQAGCYLCSISDSYRNKRVFKFINQ